MQIPEIVEIAVKLDLDFVHFEEVQNDYLPGNGNYIENLNFIKAAREKKAAIKNTIDEVKAKFNNKINIGFLSSQKRKLTCNWSFYATHITITGEVTPCCRPSALYSFGNVFNEKFTDIWNNQKMQNFRKANIENLENPICDNCPD
jgi:radical SAM protein with 4Fe4S-binding SPASM domain